MAKEYINICKSLIKRFDVFELGRVLCRLTQLFGCECWNSEWAELVAERKNNNLETNAQNPLGNRSRQVICKPLKYVIR